MLSAGGVVLSIALGSAGSVFCAVSGTSTENKRLWSEILSVAWVMHHAVLRSFLPGQYKGRSCPVQPDLTFFLRVMGSCSSWGSQGTQGTAAQFGRLVRMKEVPRHVSSLPASSAFLWSWWG